MHRKMYKLNYLRNESMQVPLRHYHAGYYMHREIYKITTPPPKEIFLSFVALSCLKLRMR